MSETFPRQYARTHRFTLGAPRAVAPAPDGSRALFLRSRTGGDRLGCLWSYDVASGEERLVADPRILLDEASEEDLPPEEKARRERVREGGAGIVSFSTDAAVRRAAVALSGRLFAAEADGSSVAELPATRPAVDPRLDPTGTRIAYVAGGALRVLGFDGAGDRALAEPDGPHVSWGLAEFIAAEEMDRYRGFWWSPDGARLLVARVDDTAVHRWHIADPANPSTPPTEVAYPAAGTPNAEVTLALVDLDGGSVPVAWDREKYPYLAAVHWNHDGPPLLLVQSRDQRTAEVLAVDVLAVDGGATTQVAVLQDDTWLHLVPGVPAWAPDGRLVTVRDDSGTDTRRLYLGGEPVTPAGLQVAAVLGVDEHGILLSGSAEPTSNGIWNAGYDGGLWSVTTDVGRHAARRDGSLLAVSSAGLDTPGSRTRLLRSDDLALIHELATYAETPLIKPRVELLSVGPRDLRTAVLLPASWSPGDDPLPVLMDPYGGPGSQRVVASHNAYLSSQWLADQGFAVVITDGRGTPGRGPAWEREIAADFGGPTLEDQVEALQALGKERPYLDLSRVAIRGWSFGGYLAALAVLRRPDVFAAAVAGAPVTDWSLYDTHYTERYLGTPQEQPAAYERSGLLAEAHLLQRPLLLIHGLADDNVVAAHTLRLSSALLAAGRPHTVLPLSGVTHMTPQEEVAENLLLLEVEFLHRALTPPAAPRRSGRHWGADGPGAR